MIGELAVSSRRWAPELLLAVVCGLGLAAVGKLFAAAIVAAIFLALSLLWPAALVTLALTSVAVSVQEVFPVSYFGLELDSVQKLFILVTVLSYAVAAGMRARTVLPVLAYGFVLLLTFSLASRPPQLTALVVFRAFVAAALPWIILSVRWDRRFAERSLLLLCLLAPASVLIGSALQLLGLYQLVENTYIGSERLAGANIPAHLALLGVVGVAASLTERVQRRPALRWLTVVNFTIVLATLTRGSVAACIVIVAFWLWQEVGTREHRHSRLVRVGIIAVVGGIAAYAFLPSLIYRTVGNPNEPGFNTSGRDDAWTFFYQQAAVNPWFGRGLGSTPVENQGQILQSVPHNEYLHLLGDAGFVGGIVVLVSMVAACRWALRRIAPPSKRLVTGFFVATALLSIVDNTFSTPQFIVPFAWFLGSLASVTSHFPSTGDARRVELRPSSH